MAESSLRPGRRAVTLPAGNRLPCVTVTTAIEVIDDGALLRFSFDDMLRYSGPGSPAGVALAYQAMRLAFGRLAPDGAVQRRQVSVVTAFQGPGARDGFELVTRCLTEGRYTVTPALERPARGVTLEQFVFRLVYRDRACGLVVREGLVTDDFISLARQDGRSAEEEKRFSAMKRALADRLLASRCEDVFDVDTDPAAA